MIRSLATSNELFITQVSMPKTVGVFQACTNGAVHRRVGKEDDPREHQVPIAGFEAIKADQDTQAFKVYKLVSYGAYCRVNKVLQHAQIRQALTSYPQVLR